MQGGIAPKLSMQLKDKSMVRRPLPSVAVSQGLGNEGLGFEGLLNDKDKKA